jgi:hypothetical protein
VTIIPFPPGMTTVTVTGTLSSLGRARTGTIRVFAERKFGYAGTDWIFDEVSPPIRLVNGKFAVPIPHSNQPGLIGDNGAAVTNIGYQIKLQPDQSGEARTLVWTLLPTSLGAGPVAFSTLANLNGWPNALIVTTPTDPVDPQNPETQMVETFPGSRIFRKA